MHARMHMLRAACALWLLALPSLAYAQATNGASGVSSRGVTNACFDDDIASEPPPANNAPTASAGADDTAVTAEAYTLAASCSDDGEPSVPGLLVCAWSQTVGTSCDFETGASDFVCVNNTSPDYDVTCDAEEAATLRLCCDDDGAGPSAAVCDTIVLTVADDVPGDAPTVAAGSDDDATAGDAYTLAASCGDDGLPDPPAALACAWTQTVGDSCTFESGASSFTCTSNASPDYDVTCDEAETSTLRLCCDDDGAGANASVCDTVTLSVEAANTAPVASAGSDDSVEVDVAYNLVGDCDDDGLPASPGTTTATWSKTAGDGSCAIGDTHDLTTTATCDAVDDVTIELECDDGLLTDTDTLVLTVEEPEAEPMALDTIDQSILFAGSVSHRLRTAYSGPIFEAHRFDNDAEQDIGTGDAVVDPADIASFCSGTTCGVSIVYDQSGNADDIAQSTEARMPTIYESSAVVVCGTNSIPCMNFVPVDFQNSDYLARFDALGLSGNPGVVAWFNYDARTVGGEVGDAFIWAIGDGVGGQYGTMKSWNNPGPVHHVSTSTRAGNERFVDASDETFGYYQHTWVASGVVDDALIYRNGTLFSTATSAFNENTSPTLTNTYFVWGANAGFNFWFGTDGYSSDLILMAAPDADDKTDLEAAFSDWN